jgi:hypothetical protein
LGGTRIRFNPFFVGSGDYRIRTLENGYSDGSYTSQVIGTSSEAKDMGCYYYSRGITSQGFSQFQTETTDKYMRTVKPIDAKIYFTNTIKPYLVKKGFAEYLDVSWTNLVEKEFNNVKAMYEATGSIYLSIDGGTTYTEYMIDKTRELSFDRPVNLSDMNFWSGVNLSMIALGSDTA